ncbi:hypothetical protein ACWIVX_04190, partial [Enterobacter asburiae]
VFRNGQQLDCVDFIMQPSDIQERSMIFSPRIKNARKILSHDRRSVYLFGHRTCSVFLNVG